MRAKAADGLDVPLSRLRAMAYALPTLPLAVVSFPAYAVLPAFYSRYTHISLSTIGMILIGSRVFDALIDPAIGYLSDNTLSRWGPRKPWLVAGAAMLAVSVYQLYVPAPTAGAFYYASWFVLFYLSFTLVDIPHKAWGTDLARDYLNRSAISTWLGTCFAVGNLAFAVVPFLPGFAGHGYDAATLRAVALFVMLILPISVALAVGLVPRGNPVASARPRLGPLLRSVVTNRPFIHFLSIFVLAGFGQGIFYSLVILLIGTVQGLGKQFPIFLLADALTTLGVVPVWFQVIARLRLEKHRAWAVGMLVSGVAIAAMAIVPPGAAGFVALLALVIMRAAGGAVFYVAPYALLGDVVDYDILRSRTNAAGNYNALISLVTKANGAVGGGIGLVLLGLIGFVTHGGNTPAAIAGFKAIVLVLPAILLAMSGVAAWLFPLDRRRHEIVRRRLIARAGSVET